MKICRPHYSDDELTANIYRKRQEIKNAGWTVSANLELIPLQEELHPRGAITSSRALQIDYEKLVMLEKEWSARGYPRLEEHYIGDAVLPAIITTSMGIVTLGHDADRVINRPRHVEAVHENILQHGAHKLAHWVHDHKHYHTVSHSQITS